jgi:hypothetical protein
VSINEPGVETRGEQDAHPVPRGSPEEMMLFVQSIKGAPASVLLALGCTGRYMSNEELQMWTRCGTVQIRLALRTLTRLGWLRARTSRGPWAIREEHRLPVVFSFTTGIDFKSTSSSGDSLNLTSRGEQLPGDRSDRLLQALYAAGIREPTATELSELPHVTLEYVQAHVLAARANHLTIGAAIEGMRKGAPAPGKPDARDRHAAAEEKFRRFMGGR